MRSNKLKNLVSKLLSLVKKRLDEIEEVSSVNVEGEAAQYFSKRVSLFSNDVAKVVTIGEKYNVLAHYEELMNILRDRVDDVDIAVDAALAYLVCGGDEE